MSTHVRASVVLLVAAVALSAPAAGWGHDPQGRAEPRATSSITGSGLTRELSVALSDRDHPEPIEGASVVVEPVMSSPHLMRLAPVALREGTAGVYRGAIRFTMPARWQLAIRVSGRDVVATDFGLPVEIDQSAASETPPAATDLTPTAVPVASEPLTESDVLAVAVLWLHASAALGWMVAVVVLLVALSTRPGVLAESARAQLAAHYRRWGAWVHWSLVLVVIATGVYNMFRIVPFDLVWRPSNWDELAAIPYGRLYESILVFKLGLFAALLVTGTQLLRRTLRGEPAVALESDGLTDRIVAALGPAGLTYLACVPMIVLAAAALRYVHILSHVAAAGG
jgi:hypothetical protein